MRRQRLRSLAVATSVAAAILLSLSVGASAGAARSDPPPPLVLEQLLNGVTQCVSPDGTCAVDLYGQDGQTADPIQAPGEQRSTTVALRNAGTLAASSLVMSAGACQNERVNDLGPPDGDLCGTVTVTVLCTTGGTTFSYGPATLSAFAQSGTHILNGGLGVGASTTCTFTVLYPINGPLVPFTRAIQPVTWTLSAEETPTTTTPPTTTAPATTQPPTTTPSAVLPTPSAPTAPPGAAVTAPPGGLALTGGNALALAIGGLVLLAVGGTLFWLSRRRDDRDDGQGPLATATASATALISRIHRPGMPVRRRGQDDQHAT